MTNRRLTAAAMLAAFAFAPIALGDDPATKPAKTGRPPVSSDPLAGPAVKQQQKKPSIVERDMQGRVIRLEIAPAEAALKVLDLDAATKQKADAILVQHAAAMDALVRDNLELIARIANAAQSADKPALAAGVKELWDKSPAIRNRSKLVDQLAGALSEEQGRQLRAIVGEYHEQRLNDEEAAAKAENRRAPGARFMLDEQLHLLGHDIKRAYERVFGQGAKEFDDILRALNLTPEQDAQIRQIFTDNFQKYKGKPTPAANAEAFLKAYTVLDAEQRKALYEKMKERGMNTPAPAAKPATAKPAAPKPAEKAKPEVTDDPMSDKPATSKPTKK